jgi:hypothetical protein
VAPTLAAAVALCMAGCGTSLTDYTCRDVIASSAKREALAEVVVVQLRAKRHVASTAAVERAIENACGGAASERLAPGDKPYPPVLKRLAR